MTDVHFDVTPKNSQCAREAVERFFEIIALSAISSTQTSHWPPPASRKTSTTYRMGWALKKQTPSAGYLYLEAVGAAESRDKPQDWRHAAEEKSAIIFDRSLLDHRVGLAALLKEDVSPNTETPDEHLGHELPQPLSFFRLGPKTEMR